MNSEKAKSITIVAVLAAIILGTMFAYASYAKHSFLYGFLSILIFAMLYNSRDIVGKILGDEDMQ